MSDDRRLIEDYLPIQAISAEASREKSVRKGHISTLHLWWARRPLVACRAAVYGALVPASRFVPENGPDSKKQSLGRANAAKFVARLCRYPSDSKPEEKADIERAVKEAQRHILEAHAERLTQETGKNVTVEDIEAGRAPRPKVLDMFAGGGAIPLEALRLGCDAYALDLNPVAHIIELCTLVYPQKYGKPDPTARGMTGPKSAAGETTWGGLASEVRYWGNWVLEKAKAEIGDLYPSMPDPDPKSDDLAPKRQGVMGFAEGPQLSLKTAPGHLTPVAYLWTRTVRCKNPECSAEVPLVRQTWLCKKKDRCVAVKLIADRGAKRVRSEIVEADSITALGFDPAVGSKGGGAVCGFCGTTADDEYVRECGLAKSVGSRLLAVVCVRPGAKGKKYLSPDSISDSGPDDKAIMGRLNALCERTGLTVPSEPIGTIRPSPNARGLSGVTRHGLTAFGDLFSLRQQLVLLTFTAAIRQILLEPFAPERSIAIADYCAATLDKVISRYSTFSPWDVSRETVVLVFGKHMLPMVWDYAEAVPIEDGSGGWNTALADIIDTIGENQNVEPAAACRRGSAVDAPEAFGGLDAIITDPPYYDNIPYADISDFFYVWLKRSIGQAHPEHFAGDLTPKRSEATALASRHQGDMVVAKAEYESMMLAVFRRAAQLLKPGGPLVIVYAHKTTLGWSTLVDALRKASFAVVEAWPLDTEYGGHLKADTSSLSSSIFLVTRRRQDTMSVGSYERDVQSELGGIIRERVETLWGVGITGADLVIAAVGAGLRAFTRYERVEYANGEEVPAERFLSEVETVVLESILARLSKEVGGNGGQYSLGGVDPRTRFYVLWRYTYGPAELDAGEAIVFANGTHVELDGPGGLSVGRAASPALVEKKKAKYRLRDHRDRGDDPKLGLPSDGQPAPLIDALQRVLWLMENRPGELPGFLKEAAPNLEQMRLVAQALAGPALKGGELANISPGVEMAALAKLTANWRSVIEDATVTAQEREDAKTGQRRLL